MYTIQFGSRSGFIDAANADAVFAAIRQGERFVTVRIDVANDGGEPFEVTFNIDHLVALIKHRVEQPGHLRAANDDSDRPRLSIVT
jgi:hypothetical protein